MKRCCVYCPIPHDMGDVEPLHDKRTTHGMCPEAAKRENTKLDELYGSEKSPVAPAVSFFAVDVVETSPIPERLVTTPYLPPIRPEWPRN